MGGLKILKEKERKNSNLKKLDKLKNEKKLCAKKKDVQIRLDKSKGDKYRKQHDKLNWNYFSAIRT